VRHLKKKGFRVTITQSESEFISLLSTHQHDVAWIVSDCSTQLNQDQQEQFKRAVVNFHNSGRGLFIYGDNDPYYYQANLVLPLLVNTRFVGDTPGSKVMSYGKADNSAEFDAENLIFSGINYLHEGFTICYPESDGKLTHIAKSSDGYPCISFLDSVPGEHGRIVLDTGFTKLYCGWDDSGQARYVVNATVYLLDVENRFQ